ncbi:MAG: protein translocase subunit SecF [Deltaproteobacteria bacterium]|nr:protein translocase subunit SecF [Deltaproteobacteria bacterium]
MEILPPFSVFCSPFSALKGVKQLELLSNTNINFLSKRRIAFVMSGIVILAGIISLVMHKGPNLGIDFRGGVQLHVKFGIPLKNDPGDDTTTAVTISSVALNVQDFTAGDTIQIVEGNKTARVHIATITPDNDTATLAFTGPIGVDFTQAAVIQLIAPISMDEIKSQMTQLGYDKAVVTSSGIDEALISVGVIDTTPVPFSADPGDETVSSVSVPAAQFYAQVFQVGDSVIIEDNGKSRVRDINSISTEGETATIEFTKPLEEDFTASATIRHQNVGRHIANSLQRRESTFAAIEGGINISEVGPNIGKDLQMAAILSIIVSLVLLLIYITLRFEIRFAVGAIAALVHDVLVTLGLFSLLAKEINLPTVAAFLTIIGYSLNDTIVVFDRIRENARQLKGTRYADIINQSINQSLSRTVITSLTTLLVVLAIFFLSGPGELNTFALALIIGVIVGTYSSVFVASPILYWWHLRLQRE